MKKFALTLFCILLFSNKLFSCGEDWWQERGYFRFFTTAIIKDKSYLPFLYSYENYKLPNDNIMNWQKYFNYEISYTEIEELVYKTSAENITNWKLKKSINDKLLQKLGHQFYKRYKEGFDYLVEAKHLPSEIISQGHYDNYEKITNDLISRYNSVKDKNIKLRYGYQIVRFQHYNLEYKKAKDFFEKYVEPLHMRTTPYFLALEQYAGVLFKLGEKDKANHNFLRVITYSQSSKRYNAYYSIIDGTKCSFDKLLRLARSRKEMVMAYFLLANNKFSNPLYVMRKIYAIDPNSDALKALQAKAIFQLEPHFLHKVAYENYTTKSRPSKYPAYINVKTSHHRAYLKQLNALESLTKEISMESNDVFWKITLAYLKFLQKDYYHSKLILKSIKTDNEEYQKEITKIMKFNDFALQRVINPKFESFLLKKHQEFLKKNYENYDYYENIYNEEAENEFMMSILANRYFLQGDKAKSFLIRHKLSALKYVPEYELVKDIYNLITKKNKTPFEKELLKEKVDVKNPENILNIMLGDAEMRKAHFSKALDYYKKVHFKPSDKNDENQVYKNFQYVSTYIFGHNTKDFYSSADKEMEFEPFYFFNCFISRFFFTKKELAEEMIRLQKVAEGNDEEASEANQLIGNVLYNTSRLGFFREVFSFEKNNIRGAKFYFYPSNLKLKFYYSISNWNWNGFTLKMKSSIKYYKKALLLCKDRERKARILYQMGLAERENIYQKIENKNRSYRIGEHKEGYHIGQNKYFRKLKKNYKDTKISEVLQSRCSLFDDYMKK